jgi:hypothetical protein
MASIYKTIFGSLVIGGSIVGFLNPFNVATTVLNPDTNDNLLTPAMILDHTQEILTVNFDTNPDNDIRLNFCDVPVGVYFIGTKEASEGYRGMSYDGATEVIVQNLNEFFNANTNDFFPGYYGWRFFRSPSVSENGDIGYMGLHAPNHTPDELQGPRSSRLDGLLGSPDVLQIHVYTDYFTDFAGGGEGSGRIRIGSAFGRGILSHEGGHVFGLAHPFQETSPKENPDGSEWSTKGDHLKDTPPDPKVPYPSPLETSNEYFTYDPETGDYTYDPTPGCMIGGYLCADYDYDFSNTMSYYVWNENFSFSQMVTMGDFYKFSSDLGFQTPLFQTADTLFGSATYDGGADQTTVRVPNVKKCNLHYLFFPDSYEVLFNDGGGPVVAGTIIPSDFEAALYDLVLPGDQTQGSYTVVAKDETNGYSYRLEDKPWVTFVGASALDLTSWRTRFTEWDDPTTRGYGASWVD